MQILRSVVAQCYRGGRTTGNCQSRDFTSSTTHSNGERVKAVDWLYGGFCVVVSYKFMQLGKMVLDLRLHEEIAAREGKVVMFDMEFERFGMVTLTPVYYDDPKI